MKSNDSDTTARIAALEHELAAIRWPMSACCDAAGVAQSTVQRGKRGISEVRGSKLAALEAARDAEERRLLLYLLGRHGVPASAKAPPPVAASPANAEEAA